MAFADAAAKTNTKKFMGITVTLPATGAYNALFIRLAPESAHTGVQIDWHPYLIDHSEVTYDSKGFGKGIVDMSDVEFTVADGLISNQPYGTLLSHLREVYTWYGAAVVVYLLCIDEDDAPYIQAIWYGNLIDWRRKNLTEFQFKAVANLDLETIIPTTLVTKAAYPLAPASSIGLPLPVVYGDFLPEPTDSGEAESWNREAEHMGLANLDSALPTICTAWDDVAAGAIFTAAEHVFKALAAGDSHNLFLRVDGEDQLAILDGTLHNSGTAHADVGAWPTLTIYLRPQGINAANTASTPELACDGKITSWANIGVGATCLALDLARPTDRGYITAITVYALFHTYATLLTATIRYGLYDPLAANWWGGYGEIPIVSSGTDEIVSHAVTGPTVKYAEDVPDDVYLRIEIINSGAGTAATIAECAVVIEYKNRTEIPAYTPPAPKRSLWQPRKPPTNARVESLPLSEFIDGTSSAAQIYVGGQGKTDDGAGSITWTPNLLLETPAHILHDLLVNVAGTGAVQQGPSTHGSFDIAGVDQDGAAIQMAFGIYDQSKAVDIVEQICRQSAMLFYRKPNSGAPAVVWWGTPAADNLYGDPIPFGDIFDLEIGETPEGDVRNAIYCAYAHSHIKRKTTRLAYFDGAGQDDGLGGTLNGPVSLVPYATSATRYGRRAFNLKLDMYRDQPSACKARNSYGAMLVEPRVYVRGKLPWKYYDLEIGHVVEFDNATFQAAGYRYPGSFASGANAGYWSFGANHHWFWIERVTYSKRGYIEFLATEGAW